MGIEIRDWAWSLGFRIWEMSLKKQAGYGRWPSKKQDMGDEKNMWDMGEEDSRDRKG